MSNRSENEELLERILLSRSVLFAAVCVLILCSPSFAQSSALIRVNQVGYLARDTKIGIAFSKTPLRGEFALKDTANRVVFRGPLKSVPAPNWGGAFTYYYELDFSTYQQPGRITLQLEESGVSSREFSVGLYPAYQDDLLLFMRQQRCDYSPYTANAKSASLVYHEGAIVRGDRTTKKLALVFTGDEFGEGAEAIANALKDRDVRGSFFLTGRFYRNPEFKTAIQRLKSGGHYLGAHSNAHLLYCDWEDRNKLLITRQQFNEDLRKNYEAMRKFGIKKTEARYFLPPFEWYNQTISDWTQALNLQLINFTPGTRSHADYTTPDMKNYTDSKAILESIKKYEATDPAGMNGFLLLFHIGVGPKRQDKVYNHLGELIDWLRARNYELVRVDELLDPKANEAKKWASSRPVDQNSQ